MKKTNIEARDFDWLAARVDALCNRVDALMAVKHLFAFDCPHCGNRRVAEQYRAIDKSDPNPVGNAVKCLSCGHVFRNASTWKDIT